jgi:hypothetical protein
MTNLLDTLTAGRQASWPMTMFTLLVGAAGAVLFGLSD